MSKYYDKYWALVEAIRETTGGTMYQGVCIDDILFNIDTAQEGVPYAP